MTIGIRKVEKKQFPYEIDQVAGYRNKIPSEETRTLIYHWLESNRKIYLNSANLD
jgi:hypothetical protein